MPQIAGSLDAISANLNQEQRDQLRQPMPIEIAAGEACFHHPLTLHGSEGNRSDRPRRAMVINVILDGTQSLSDEPLLEGIDPIPRGSPLSGQFFPLLEI
jgi:ectoine hydroxylase-related dioxygenase (phytanoyl-CoA dioxygenase family)